MLIMLNFERIRSTQLGRRRRFLPSRILAKIAVWHEEQHANLLIKRKKLKLGAISFEIKEHVAPGTTFLLFETIDIRFINQDNTEEDERSFEARLARYKIKRPRLLCSFIILLILFSTSIFCIFAVDLVFNTPSIFANDSFSLKNVCSNFFLKIKNVKHFLMLVNNESNSIFLECFSYFLINILKLI